MNHADLLIEIGVEELPAAASQPMAESFAKALLEGLKESGLADSASTHEVFSTPRRLAVLVHQVAAQQQDKPMERKGPAVAAAFDAEGNPTKAVQGFARSCGVEVSELETVSTPKGDWLIFKTVTKGQSLADYLANSLVNVLRQLPSPRRMRWSDGDTEFLRPVRWLTALHGSELLPLELLGQQSVAHTFGHRFHAPGKIAIANAAEYESQLLDGFVIANFTKRQQRIVEQVQACADQSGGAVVMDPALVDEVTSLVEWPVAIAGEFEQRFLSLPKEALIQTMEENQRYFALLDKQGNLHPGFVTVANIESSEPQSVREGNERVIRPRFADTLFFWEKDCQQTLEARRPALEKVLFQKDLGSTLEKTARLEVLAEFLAECTSGSVADCVRAAQLAKCDLVTETVGELAKMQGIAGSYLAQADGESAAVSAALREQYLPLKAGGELPATPVGQVLSMADKTDTLVGIFGIGQKPSGAKDPFALRRAAAGLLRIIIESDLSIDLRDLFTHSAQSFAGRLSADFNIDELLDFVLERLRSYNLDRGETHDVIEAVAAKGITDPRDFNLRVTAIAGFRQSDAAESLAAASKRINNILRKSGEAAGKELVRDQLVEEAEKILAEELRVVSAELEPHFDQGDYVEAMRSTAKLRESVDAFFDGVMVMVDDEKLRANRLALLSQVAELCSRTADLSQLQPAT